MIVLASQSPRRAALLKQIGIEFIQMSVDADESQLTDESATEYVKRLAKVKATLGWQRSSQAFSVLGADTICVLDDQILHKPVDRADAKAMLSRMSGREHWVFTAVAVISADQCVQELVSTRVTFKRLSQAEIDWYWESGEPADKAGSYGIQGLGGQFVTRIDGSYSAVVGLPLYETAKMLNTLSLGGATR